MLVGKKKLKTKNKMLVGESPCGPVVRTLSLSLPWAWGLIPGWEAKWQATPVFLPRKSHEWRSLVGYSPWGRKESDATERLHFLYFLSLGS